MEFMIGRIENGKQRGWIFLTGSGTTFNVFLSEMWIWTFKDEEGKGECESKTGIESLGVSSPVDKFIEKGVLYIVRTEIPIHPGLILFHPFWLSLHLYPPPFHRRRSFLPTRKTLMFWVR